MQGGAHFDEMPELWALSSHRRPCAAPLWRRGACHCLHQHQDGGHRAKHLEHQSSAIRAGDDVDAKRKDQEGMEKEKV